MEAALVCGPFAAALGAVVFGWFCVRLSGVYLAMLTLAFAQIAWSIVFQWDQFTGGSNGIVGVWPAPWLASKTAFYYLALTLCGCGIWLLRRIVFSPYGYALRAGRDSPLRCDAIGIDLARLQWAAFVLVGTFAGLAGAIYAFSKGSTPESQSYCCRWSVICCLRPQTVSGPVWVLPVPGFRTPSPETRITGVRCWVPSSSRSCSFSRRASSASCDSDLIDQVPLDRRPRHCPRRVRTGEVVRRGTCGA
jgi:hypothetical protein